MNYLHNECNLLYRLLIHKVYLRLAILLDHMKGTEFVNRSDKNDFLYFDKSYSSEESAYGVLLKNIEVYNYISQVIRDNRLLVEACINARYKKKEVSSFQ